MSLAGSLAKRLGIEEGTVSAALDQSNSTTEADALDDPMVCSEEAYHRLRLGRARQEIDGHHWALAIRV